MSEKEKEIIRKVAQALPDMSDMNKGYFSRLCRSYGISEEPEERRK